MQIILDVSRLVSRFLEKIEPTGVDRVTLAYAQHFSTTHADSTRALLRWRGLSGIFSARQSKVLFDVLLCGHRTASDRMAGCLVRGIVSTWFNGDGRRYLMLQTAHQDVETQEFWRIMRWHAFKPVFFVHDVIPISHPQFCRGDQENLHRLRLSKMQRSVGLITNSAASKAQLESFYRLSGHDTPPIKVGLLGIEEHAPKSATGQPSRADADIDSRAKTGDAQSPGYFICLGTIEPRKNHRLLLDVWRHLMATMPEENLPVLKIIGQSGWGCEDIEAELLDETWHRGKVQWLSDCADEELAHQLRGARALLFPTHVEGFGLPVAEALAAGTPVIASDLPVFKEFAANTPEYLNIDNLHAWAQAVMDYAAEGERRRAQLDRIKQWQAPTWAHHFSVVTPWLEALWQEHVGKA